MVEAGCRLWRDIRYGEVLGPLLSARDLGLVLRFGLEFAGAGAGVGGVPSLLDDAPLADTIQARISFGQLARNVQSGVIEVAGAAARSYQTGGSMVFYHGPVGPARDDRPAIDYVWAAGTATAGRA